MAIEIWNATSTNKLAIDSQGQARAILYDAAGNVCVPVDKSTAPTGQGGFPIMGLDSQKILRAARVDCWGGIKGSQAQLLWWDPVETAGGVAPNLNIWTQTVGSAMTVTSAATDPVQILNNNNTLTSGAYAMLVSTTQFSHFGRIPMAVRGRLRFNWVLNAQLEFGFGNPATGTTAVVDGVFFRMKNDGTFVGVFAYNSSETEISLGLPTIVTTRYYDCAIFVDDDFVRWVVTDANNVPIVDVTTYLTTTSASQYHVTHLPVFQKIVNVTAPASGAQLIAGATTVELLDTSRNKLWHHVCAGMLKDALHNPLTGAATSYFPAGLPSLQTPSNSAINATYQVLGGKFNMAASATSENDLAIFAYTVPAPYALYITGINIPLPLNQGAAIAVTDTVLEWGFITNGTSPSSVSAAAGQRNALPGYHRGASGTAIGVLYSGTDIRYTPETPIVCLSGATFFIVYRVVLGTATVSQAIRGQCTIDGYFE